MKNNLSSPTTTPAAKPFPAYIQEVHRMLSRHFPNVKMEAVPTRIHIARETQENFSRVTISPSYAGGITIDFTDRQKIRGICTHWGQMFNGEMTVHSSRAAFRAVRKFVDDLSKERPSSAESCFRPAYDKHERTTARLGQLRGTLPIAKMQPMSAQEGEHGTSMVTSVVI